MFGAHSLLAHNDRDMELHGIIGPLLHNNVNACM